MESYTADSHDAWNNWIICNVPVSFSTWESGTINKAARRSNQSILKEISPEYLLILSWSSNTLASWCKEPTHWKRPWCWERLRAGEGGERGWVGWMASPTWWHTFEQTMGESEGQGSLVRCSPWGHRESDMTDWTTAILLYLERLLLDWFEI